MCSENESKIYIFDFARTVENFVSYEALETIKNGIYFSGKYESKTVVRNCPHVLVFSNFLPHMESLSLDRWNITEIKKEKQKIILKF